MKQRGTSCIVPNAVIKIRTGRYHAASPGFCCGSLLVLPGKVFGIEGAGGVEDGQHHDADVGVMVLAVLNATRALYTKDLARKNEQ